MKYIVLIALTLTLANCGHGKFRKSDHHMFNMLDANSDGKVSKEEFNSTHEKMFTEMDADKDGFVTKDEKKSWYKSQKEKSCSK